MSLSTLTISQNDYKSYASVAEADVDLAVDPVRSAAWTALDSDQKAIRLVSATRRLDLLPWRGAPAEGPADQETAWPRSGLKYEDGSDVPSDAIPRSIELATILLAGTITTTPAHSNAGTVTPSIRRVRAGSAEVEFAPIAVAIPDPLRIKDETVQALIGQWLAGRGSAAGGAAYGTDQESQFEDENPFRRTYGFS